MSARKKKEPALPAPLPFHVSLYLESPCGWHNYLIIKRGRKWARLVSTENAEAITVATAILGTAKPMPLKLSRIARRLRRLAREYGHGKSAHIRAALQLLKTADHTKGLNQ